MEQKDLIQDCNKKNIKPVSILPKEVETSVVFYMSLLILYFMVTFLLMSVTRSSETIHLKETATR